MVEEVGAGMVNCVLAAQELKGTKSIVGCRCMFNGKMVVVVRFPRTSTTFRIGDHESSRDALNAA